MSASTMSSIFLCRFPDADARCALISSLKPGVVRGNAARACALCMHAQRRSDATRLQRSKCSSYHA